MLASNEHTLLAFHQELRDVHGDQTMVHGIIKVLLNTEDVYLADSMQSNFCALILARNWPRNENFWVQYQWLVFSLDLHIIYIGRYQALLRKVVFKGEQKHLSSNFNGQLAEVG